MTRTATLSDGDRIEFDVFGDSGPFVFLGPQLYLSPPTPGTDWRADAYVDSLSNRYRIILANWPRGMGQSSPPKAETLCRDHAIRDVHAIADAAGAQTFAWWGYSFGAAIGLQLARNNARVSALVCAGFPPLFQPHSDMLGLLLQMKRRSMPEGVQMQDAAGALRQSIAFYESVVGQDDWEAIEDITCPRLVLHDVNDAVDAALGFSIKVDLAERTRAAEADLKRLGWELSWIDTGKGHLAMTDAAAMLEGFAPFLDRVLLG